MASLRDVGMSMGQLWKNTKKENPFIPVAYCLTQLNARNKTTGFGVLTPRYQQAFRT